MRTSINLEETDIKNMLDQVINHPNKEDIVMILTSLVCDSSLGVEWFTKCFIGTKLPEVYPNGTIVKINITEMDYETDKEATIKSHFNIGNNQVIGTIESFRGFNTYSPYQVKCKFINKTGVETEATQYLAYGAVERVEEF